MVMAAMTVRMAVRVIVMIVIVIVRAAHAPALMRVKHEEKTQGDQSHAQDGAFVAGPAFELEQ